MDESLIYRISKQFVEGQSTLTLYAFSSDFDGISYCFEHDKLNRHCGSFIEAIGIALEEWGRMKDDLIIIEFKSELTESEKAEIPF